jgi:carboxyl-terminal processing protease
MMLTGKYAGIGALVKYHLKKKRVVIDEPYEGNPAAEAGLQKGDIILSIDDSVMTDKYTNDVSSRLRGDAGTSFVLKIMRPSTGKEMKLKITRRNIKLPELPFYGMLDDGVGYINFNQFTEGSAREVRRAFVELKKQGATSLVFDLRDNGGGSEMEAVDIVNLWVPKGQLVVENRGKVKQTNRRYETRLEPVDTIMPIAVLVNEHTASASEITSGSLQDLDRAIVVGTRTYGKGLVQIPLDMPYNSNVKITTAHYYIPSGRCIQAFNYKRNGNERVADSLQAVFHTRGGREVKAGGGILPDVVIEKDTLPNIAYYLSGSGIDSTEVAFDYVVDYVARHPSIAPAKEFRLTDADWQEFRQRVIDSGFSYDPVSRKQFDELVKTAKFEGYYEGAREAFDALQAKLKHDVTSDLDSHREIIQQMLELDIVSVYYYQRGMIEAGLRFDKQVKEAIRLLKDEAEYKKLLQPKH